MLRCYIKLRRLQRDLRKRAKLIPGGSYRQIVIAIMNAPVFLVFALLGGLFRTNKGAPLINRRQESADQPLPAICPENRAVTREEFSNADE